MNNTFCSIRTQYVPKTTDEEISPAVFHVLCNPNRFPCEGIFIPGVSGEFKNSSERCPFVLLPDGTGDYGAACDGEPDRTFRTNFRSKRMERGELFTVWYIDTDRGNGEFEATYRIVDVTVLAGPAFS